MILVDTSVLIDFLSGTGNAATAILEEAVRDDLDFCLLPVIVQEVLQGARDEAEWRTLKDYLGSQFIFQPEDPLESCIKAGRIFFDCRRKGLTVRSATDCFIAQVALQNKMTLLHSDRDFETIARVRPLATLP